MLKKTSLLLSFATAAALCLSSCKEPAAPAEVAPPPVSTPSPTPAAQAPTPEQAAPAAAEATPATETTPVAAEEPSAPVEPVDPAPVLAALGADGRKILLAHVMPWYETPAVRGNWGFHWSGGNPPHDPEKLDEKGLPDIRSHFHPLIGLYDSTDPDVLECQLLQMKIAGINGVIADWYGIASLHDFPAIHTATGALFDAVGKQNMKFAVCYEDRTIEALIKNGVIQESDIPAHLKEMAAWLADEWFPAPQYFRFDGRPLLLNFGPIFVKDRDAWTAGLDLPGGRPAFFALHHLWKRAGADGGFSWVHTEPFQGEPASEEIIQKLKDTHSYRSNDPLKAIPSAYPGYKDIYEQSLLSLDRREGRTMLETLQAAMEGPWPVVQLVTWNDYGEGTIIEPTHETGYTDLEIIQDARRKEMGEAFTFTKEDLRLPARLLALRQKGTAPKAELDSIAAQLAAGQCATAKNSLTTLESK